MLPPDCSDTRKMVRIMVNILLEVDAISQKIKQKAASAARIRKCHTVVSEQCDELFSLLNPTDGSIRTCKELLLRLSNHKTDLANEILGLSSEREVYKAHLGKVDKALANEVNWSDM